MMKKEIQMKILLAKYFPNKIYQLYSLFFTDPVILLQLGYTGTLLFSA